MRYWDALRGSGLLVCQLLGSLFWLIVSVNAYAGAWPTDPGEGQVIATSLFDHAKTGYDGNGDIVDNVSFNKSEEALYWEHGLTAKTTMVIQSSYQDIQFRAGVDVVDFSGIGESYVGLRRMFWRSDNWVFSGQAGVLFAGAGETVADADLGFGSTHYEARLLVGRSFKLAQKDGFLDVQVAQRFRPGNAPNEWRLDGTVGWRPKDKFQLIAQGFYTDSAGQFEIARANKRLKLQGSLVYEHNPKTSYQIGVYQTVAGQNIVKEKAFFIAVWTRY